MSAIHKTHRKIRPVTVEGPEMPRTRDQKAVAAFTAAYHRLHGIPSGYALFTIDIATKPGTWRFEATVSPGEAFSQAGRKTNLRVEAVIAPHWSLPESKTPWQILAFKSRSLLPIGDLIPIKPPAPLEQAWQILCLEPPPPGPRTYRTHPSVFHIGALGNHFVIEFSRARLSTAIVSEIKLRAAERFGLTNQ